MAILHFTLATRSVADTAAFFERAFGWRRVARPSNIPMAAAWLEIAPSQELHIVEVTDFEASSCEQEFGRHVALSFPKAGLGELKERLQQQGADLIAPARDTPHERFFFRDPNGYVFEVIEDERSPEE